MTRAREHRGPVLDAMAAARLQALYDSETGSTLRPAILVVGVASLAYVPVHLARHLPGTGLLAPVAGVFGVLYLLLWAWTARRPVAAEHTHALYSAVALVAGANTILNQALVGNPMLTFDMALVIILTGMCIVSQRWALFTVAVQVVGWFAFAAPDFGTPEWSSAAASIGFAVGGCAIINTGRRAALARLFQVTEDAERAAVIDSLTQVYNRRGLALVAAHVVRTARRTGEHVGVIVLDIDNFKGVNDQLGHQAGDRTLVAVADALKAGGRDSDVVARWGGDEFVVVTLGTAPNADELAHRVERDLSTSGVSGPGGRPVRVSVGAANLSTIEDPDVIDQLIVAADAAMYAGRAKRRPSESRVVALDVPQNLSTGR
ncbi:MAG: GGDEF domain-containing protein [Mycobacteriales bacterium]